MCGKLQLLTPDRTLCGACSTAGTTAAARARAKWQHLAAAYTAAAPCDMTAQGCGLWSTCWCQAHPCTPLAVSRPRQRHHPCSPCPDLCSGCCRLATTVASCLVSSACLLSIPLPVSSGMHALEQAWPWTQLVWLPCPLPPQDSDPKGPMAPNTPPAKARPRQCAAAETC